jgi:hypothetical protein
MPAILSGMNSGLSEFPLQDNFRSPGCVVLLFEPFLSAGRELILSFAVTDKMLPAATVAEPAIRFLMKVFLLVFILCINKVVYPIPAQTR